MRYRLVIIITLLLGLTVFLAACPSSDQVGSQQAQVQWRLSDYLPAPFHSSIWSALPGYFELKKEATHQLVQKEIKRLQKHQTYINDLTRNARPYLYYVFQQTRKHKMPAEVALLPMVESDYTPFAYSNKGAMGLWQIMPGTASGFGLLINWWYDGRRDIVASTDAALRHLQYLHSYFGDWLLAMAAYDSGRGTVHAAIRYNERHHKPTDFWSLRLPKETKRYIPKLLALAAIIRDSNHYGLHLNSIPNRPYFSTVKMHEQIDLSHAAKLANISKELMRKLNPGFRRWATSLKREYTLLLPISKVRAFMTRLKQTKNQKVTWLHHRVLRSDNLKKLAKRYHTTVSILQRVNKLGKKDVRSGQWLLVPKAIHKKFSKKIARKSGAIAADRLPGPKRIVYSVKSRDTLESIARRYRIKPAQIRYWNKLGYHAKLKPNQKLIFWKKNFYPTNKGGSHLYTIRKGDSLSRIASRFHVSIASIKRFNHLNGNVVRIGYKLNVPYSNTSSKNVIHTVRSGESLSRIAQYYHVSSRKIVTWNHLQNEKYLHVGERLKIKEN